MNSKDLLEDAGIQEKYLPGFWETSRSGKDSFVFPPLCFGALPCTFWCMQPIDSTLSLYIFISRIYVAVLLALSASQRPRSNLRALRTTRNRGIENKKF